METGKWLPPHCWETAPKPQLEKEGCLDKGRAEAAGEGSGEHCSQGVPGWETPHLTPGMLSFTGCYK